MVDSIFFIMLLLVGGFIGTRVAQFFRMPHSVFLVVIGVAAGLGIRYYDPGQVASLEHLFPEIILFVLLPPLIFESAYNFELKELKRDLFPISFFAVVALCVSTAIVGFAMHFLFHLSLVSSLTFGALISATDPVAVVALFKKIGAPKRLNTLIEGESLFNDGAAIVLYRVLVSFVAATAFTPSMITEGIQQFFIVALGGAVVGLGLFYVTSLLLKMTSDSSAQLGLTITAAYTSFIVADHFLHVSGVIATMVVGLLLGHRARLEFNKEALHGMHYVWEFLALSANTIVFFGVGLSVDPAGFKGTLHLILPALGIVYFARAIAIYGLCPLVNATRLASPISYSQQTLMVWGGLRGGLALALVLLLPHDFPNRQLFLSLASAVVLSTLFVNALTIERMLGWFGLNKLASQDQRTYLKTLKEVIDSSFSSFDRAKEKGQYSVEIVDRQKQVLNRLLDFKASQLAERVDWSQSFDLDQELNFALLKEKALYNHKLEEGFLSKKAYISLIGTIEQRESLLEKKRTNNISSFPFSSIMDFDRKSVWNFFSDSNHLSVRLETLLHLRLALEDIRDQIQYDELREILTQWLKRAEMGLEKFYNAYPDGSAFVQTQYISGAVCANAESRIQRLMSDRVISSAIGTRLQEDIIETHHFQTMEARKLLSPSTQYLIKRVPLFHESPDALLESLCQKAQKKSFKAGEKIVSEGDSGESFYLVAAGVLEVQSQTLESAHLRPRLFVGDFFGEMSLLLGQARSATVTATVDAQVLEIFKEDFLNLMADHPEIKDKILSVANERQVA